MNLRFFLISLCMSALFFASCGDDEATTVDCTTNGCPEGFTCTDGVCVQDDPNSNEIIVTDNVTTDATWTADKCYILAGRITVEDGATLTIEPGTVIKGQAGTGAAATALLIARGGKLMADGTADAPIIMTGLADEIEKGQVASPNLDPSVNGTWGGLIVLGRAPISVEGDEVEVQIEGIPATDPNGLYGGTDPEDNSGVIRYVSVRHGGANIGAGNEINGITLGGVGSGTVIENVEVVANQDDGIEWFGGTVNVKNALVWNAGDDAIDTDQAWSGTLDNFIVVGAGDANFELDGPEGSATATHTIMNGSIVAGANELIDLDPSSVVNLMNIYFTGIEDGNKIEDKEGAEVGATDFGAGVSFTNITLDFAEGTIEDYVNFDVPAGVTEGTTPQADKSVFGWTWAADAGGLDNL